MEESINSGSSKHALTTALKQNPDLELANNGIVISYLYDKLDLAIIADEHGYSFEDIEPYRKQYYSSRNYIKAVIDAIYEGCDGEVQNQDKNDPNLSNYTIRLNKEHIKKRDEVMLTLSDKTNKGKRIFAPLFEVERVLNEAKAIIKDECSRSRRGSRGLSKKVSLFLSKIEEYMGVEALFFDDLSRTAPEMAKLSKLTYGEIVNHHYAEKLSLESVAKTITGLEQANVIMDIYKTSPIELLNFVEKPFIQKHLVVLMSKA